jgi:hypothetical protein
MSVETLRTSGRTGSQTENCRSLHKILPLPGGLYAEPRRCGRLNCRCVAGGDALHGPYLYRRWLENGRHRSEYVRTVDAARVRAGIAEWRRLHPPARSARQALADLRRLFGKLEQLEE